MRSFYLIFHKNLRDMLSWKRTLILVAIGVLVPVLYCSLQWSSAGTGASPLIIQTQFIADRIVLLWYLWGAGLLLAITVTASAAGFIAQENKEGTLVLMFTRPINRYELVLSKLAALLLYSLLVSLASYLLTILLLWGILGLHMHTFKVLWGILPAMMLYSIIVSLFFSAISAALSAMLRSIVMIMMIVMVLVIYTYFLGMLIRSVSAGSSGVPAIDVGYHAGNTFDLINSGIDFWEMSPAQRDLLSQFTGTYNTSLSDNNAALGKIDYLYPANHINPAGSMAIMLLVPAGLTGLSLWLLQKKEYY